MYFYAIKPVYSGCWRCKFGNYQETFDRDVNEGEAILQQKFSSTGAVFLSNVPLQHLYTDEQQQLCHGNQWVSYFLSAVCEPTISFCLWSWHLSAVTVNHCKHITFVSLCKCRVKSMHSQRKKTKLQKLSLRQFLCKRFIIVPYLPLNCKYRYLKGTHWTLKCTYPFLNCTY